MIKEKIKENLKQALGKMEVKDEPIIEIPANPDFGDYSTSIALKLTKVLKKNPLQIAQEIATNLQKDDTIEKVEVVKPGFINFKISTKQLLEELNTLIDKGDEFGKHQVMKGKKIMIEYTDPNPFKEFHLGHLFSNSVGESLARLYESLGANVKRANYQGDVGMHVAKSIWGMIDKIKKGKLEIKNLEKLTLSEKAKFMGEAYTSGAQAYEKNETAKKEIIKLNKKIYQQDSDIKQLYALGRQWTLNYFETLYKRLGTKFDFYYFERQAGEVGLKYVKENLKKGIFKESEGAIVFDGKKYGLHTRVFINSQGLPTYEAKDLGLAPTKYADFPYDLSIIVTGNEINEYFKVVFKALEQINHSLFSRTRHVSHGMLRLPQGKMSSRTGRVITAEWLIDEVKNHLKTIVGKGGRVTKNQMEEINEIVTIGAIKYSLLKANMGKDVIFDFKETLSFEGNSGPYLQYSYARCQSVLKQGNKVTSKQSNIDINHDELSLLRSFIKYPMVVYNAAILFSPHLICNYLFELAQKFNLFYQKNPILKAEKQTRDFRLLLTKATAQVLKNGLYLLGIKTVEKM